MSVQPASKATYRILKTIIGLGCTIFQATDVWGQNYYIFTPITGAQTQIDTNNTSTFQINVSAGASLNLGGAVFTLKEGPSTTAGISLTVYASSIAPGNIIGSVDYTNSQFDTVHPGTNEERFEPTPFPPTAPSSTFLTLSGGGSGVQYFVTLTSPAPDTQSTAYFIKGADAAFLGDSTGTAVTLTGIGFFPPGAPVLSPITGTVTTNNLSQFQPVLDGGTIVSDPNATTVTENISITNNNGTLDANSITTTYSGNFTGPGGLTITNTGGGAGFIKFSGTNTYSGATNVTGGTLQAAATNTLSPNSAVTVNSPAVLDLNNFNQTIGSLAGTGNTTLGSATLTTGGNNTSTTYSGAISGTGGLTKDGTGTFTLSGTNTYSGATTVNDGTLQAGATNTLSPNSAVTVNSPGILDLNNFNQTIGSLAGTGNTTLGSATLTTGGNNTSTTYSGAISGTGGLTKDGTGTFTLSGANTYSGATTINDGTLQAGATNTLSPNSAVTVNSPGILDLNNFNQTIGSLSGAGNTTLGSATLTTGGNNTSTTYSGAISGTGGLTKDGTGTFTLSGTNTYSGATTVNDGTLQAAATNTLSPNSAVTVNSPGILDLNNFNQTIGSLAGAGNTTLGSATLTTGVNNTSTTYSGNISGTGGLTKDGTGTFTLSGTNTYSGATTINDGTLQAGATDTLSPNSAVTVNSPGILDLNNFNQTIGSLAGAGNTTLGSATLTTGVNNTSTTYSGNISGTGGLTKDGTGTFTVTGTNTYTGGTEFKDGVLNVGSPGALGSSGTLSFTGGTLQYSALNTTDYSSRFSAASGQLYSIDTNGQNITYATALTSSGGTLTKTGTGSLTLSANNTYSGDTNINGGTLILSGSNQSTSYTIAPNATLTPTVSNAFAPGADINNSGTLNLAGLNGLTPINVVANNFVQTSTGTTEVYIDPTGASSNLDLGGNLTLAGALDVNTNPAAGTGSVPPYSAGQTFGVITYDGTRSGVFANITDDLAQFDIKADYSQDGVISLVLIPVLTTSPTSLPGFVPTSIATQTAGNVLQTSTNTSTGTGSGGAITNLAQQTAQNRLNTVGVLNPQPVTASSAFSLTQATGSAVVNQERTFQKSANAATVGGSTTTIAETTGNQTANNFMNGASLSLVASGQLLLSQTTRQLDLSRVETTNSASATSGGVASVGSATTTTAQTTGNFVNTATVTPAATASVGLQQSLGGIGAYPVPNPVTNLPINTDGLATVTTNNATATSIYSLGAGGSATIRNVGQNADLNLNGFSSVGTGAVTLSGSQNGTLRAFVEIGNTANATGSTGNAAVANTAQSSDITLNTVAAGGALDLGTGSDPFLQITQDISHLEFTATPGNPPATTYTVNTLNAQSAAGTATISNAAPGDQVANFTQNQIAATGAITGLAEQSAAVANIPEFRNVATATATAGVASTSDVDQSQTQTVNTLSGGSVSAGVTQLTTNAQSRQSVNIQTATGSKIAAITDGDQSNGIALNQLSTTTGGVSGTLSQTTTTATLAGANTRTASGADTAQIAGGSQTQLLSQNVIAASTAGVSGGITQTAAAANLTGSNSVTTNASGGDAAITGLQQGQAQYANMLTGGAFSGVNVNQSSTGAIAMTANNSQNSTGADSANLLGAGQTNTLALNMVSSSNNGGSGSVTQTSAATSLSSTNSLTGASTSNTASTLTGVQSSTSIINMSR